MAGQSNPYTPITFSAVLPLKNCIFIINMPPPTQTQLGSSQYGEVFQNKQISWLKISSYTPVSVGTSSVPTFLVTHWLRDASIPWDEFLENFKLQTAPAPPPCPRFRKLCGAFSNEIFRIGLTPLPDSVWLRPNQTRQNLPDRPELPSWRQQPVVAKKESCFEDIRLFAIKVRIYNVHNMISAVVLSHFPREWAFRIVSVETIVILQWTEQLNSAAKNILADLSSDFNFAATLPSVTFWRG